MTVYLWFTAWKKFWRIVWLYKAHDDLDGLVQWAGRKKLYGVKEAYTNKWLNIDRLLFKTRIENTRRDIWARRTYQIYKLIKGNTQYKKGYASQYRSHHI